MTLFVHKLKLTVILVAHFFQTHPYDSPPLKFDQAGCEKHGFDVNDSTANWWNPASLNMGIEF